MRSVSSQHPMGDSSHTEEINQMLELGLPVTVVRDLPALS